MSKKEFTYNEFKLLNKDLNFCPTPGRYNKSKYNNDVNNFIRKIKLKAHFKNTENVNKNSTFYIRNSNKNPWTPKQTHHTVETFTEAFKNELKEEQNKQTQLPKNNLTTKEREALRDLSSREDIIITKADKGGAVVIMDVNDYINEANRQLDNTEFYKKLTSDPTNTNKYKVNNAIKELQSSRLIDEKLANKLEVKEAKTPYFKMFPKIHKEGNPGRPVISSVNCHTSNISQYIDYELQPHVKELKSYVKDSTDFIQKIDKVSNISENNILVTMDVRSLYTNIPHEEGIKAVETTLARKGLPTRVIITFLRLILTLNNFIFNTINYLQIKGCAMGTKCAPTYANIFMGIFEETYIYGLIKEHCKLYLRYIDDIFLIWTGTINELKDFIEKINQVHPSIKFDFNFSKQKVNFLDTTVTKDSNGKLITSLYKKETDRQAYLHNKSEHPMTLKKSIPYAQALRLRRICTKEEDFMKQCSDLTKRFIERGYQKTEIQNDIIKAKRVNRTDLLNKSNETKSTRIPFILTYNRTLPNVKRAVNKHWSLLHVNSELKEVFKDPPMICFRRNKNLNDILGSKTIINNKVLRKSNIKQTGFCKPCYSKNGNLCCKQVLERDSFKSNVTQRKYKIYNKTTCKSSWLIYLMECTLCKKQYIGKSETPFNLRLNNHRKDVFKPSAPEADQHFRLPGHQFNKHAKFTLIEQLNKTNDNKSLMSNRLKKREDFWIIELQTLKPNGFNAEINFPNP